MSGAVKKALTDAERKPEIRAFAEKMGLNAELVEFCIGIAALAEKMGAKASRLPISALAACATCYAIPTYPGVSGFNHLAVWPGRLEDFQPGERGDDLRIAAAYLILEIERLEKPADAAAA